MTVTLRPPVVGIVRNPMQQLRQQDMVQVRPGQSLLELQLAHIPLPQGLLICKLNGEIVLRLTEEQEEELSGIDVTNPTPAQLERLRELALQADNWRRICVRDGDIVEFRDEPGNREVTRIALQLALVASLFTPFGQAFTPYLAAANVAFNLALPPRAPKPGDPAEGVFSAQLAGNSARIDQPIPKLCGRAKYTPPYGAAPYTKFVKSNETHPDRDRDAYLYAMFALTLGNLVIEKTLIGKTSITRFPDVFTNELLAPGVAPSVVKPNTLTSSEISSSELDSKMVDGVFTARYTGGIAGCRPGDTFSRFSIDTGADQGLGRTTSAGGSDTATVKWQVEQATLDDYGRAIADAEIVAIEIREEDTNTPQRWTNDYELPAPARAEVRLVRTNLKNTDSNTRDSLQWIGFRVELDRGAPLNAQTSHLEIVMRGNELSPRSQQDFSIIGRGLLRTWSAGTWSATEVESRNPGWWALDLLRQAKYSEIAPRWGFNYPDERIDIASFVDFADVCDTRQDHFDYVFLERIDAWEALQLICRAGRARAFRKANGVISVARDELILAPVAAFTPRTHGAGPGSMRLEALLPDLRPADGILAKFISSVSWDEQTIECPAPGRRPSGLWGTLSPLMVYDPSLPVMENPVARSYPGITGRTHAEREGLYDAADGLLRRTTGQCTVEMEGALRSYMDPVYFMPEHPGYGQAGDVDSWDEATLTMGLSEPVIWGEESLYLWLRRDDGSLTSPVLVSAGDTANDVVLAVAPDFELILDNADRDRPQYMLGPLVTGTETCKIIGRTDGGRTEDGAQLFDIQLLIDHDDVHTRDTPLLPGPGDVQDPIDDGLDYGGSDAGGTIAALVRLVQRDIASNASDSEYGGLARYTLGLNGVASSDANWENNLPTLRHTNFAGEWITTSPVDPTVAARYEVSAFDYGSFAPITAGGGVCSGPIDPGVWSDLAANVAWQVHIADPTTYSGPVTINPGGTIASALLELSIRRKGTELVLAKRKISLTILLGPGGSGG